MHGDARLCVYGCGLIRTKLQNSQNHAIVCEGNFKNKDKKAR
jgi:hypothetical protein